MATDELVADIPLCAGHAAALRARLSPQLLSDALAKSTGVVYYVSWRSKPDIVKIGTTTNLRYRLRQLSTKGDPAKVLVAEPGHYYLEKKRHRQFSHLRLNDECELFRWVPQLADHIREVRTKVGWTGGALEAADLPIIRAA